MYLCYDGVFSAPLNIRHHVRLTTQFVTVFVAAYVAHIVSYAVLCSFLFYSILFRFH